MIVQRRLVLLIQQGTNIDNIDCRVFSVASIFRGQVPVYWKGKFPILNRKRHWVNS